MSEGVEMVEVRRTFEGEKLGRGKVFYNVDYWTKGEYWEGVTRISKVYYPIWPYLNNVRYTLEIRFEDAGLCFHTYRIRDSWNGTGLDNIIKVCVDLAGLEDVPFLEPRELEKINDLDGLKKFLGYVKSFIEDAATITIENLQPEEPDEDEE